MQFKRGSYTGNGTSQSITGIGFAPDIVIVKSYGLDRAPYIRSTDMPATNSKQLIDNLAFVTTQITSLDADGFSVGSGNAANENGETIQYIAIKAAVADCKIGTYVGNGADNRSISGIGFEPTMVWVWRSGDEPMWKSNHHTTEYSRSFKDFALDNAIQALEADGFQVGSDDPCNQNAVTYYYAAFKASSIFTTFTYEGNGADDRALTGLGFEPDFVFVQIHKEALGPTGERIPWLKFNNAAVDESSPIGNVLAANGIQALQSDGIEIGTEAEVNPSTDELTVTGFAFADGVSVAPGTIRRSTDYGQTWTNLTNPIGTARSFHMAADGRLWGLFLTGTTLHVYYSDDNGSTWTSSMSIASVSEPGFIACHPSDANRIACSYQTSANTYRVATTIDRGANWSNALVNATNQTIGRASGRLHWFDFGRIATAYDISTNHVIVSISDDDGATWAHTLDITTSSAGPHVQDFIIAGNGGPLFLALDLDSALGTGLIRRSQDGVVWESLDTPVSDTQPIRALAYDIQRDNLYILYNTQVAGSTFPEIVDITATSINLDGSPKAINMPPVVDAGDLLLMCIDVNGTFNLTINTPSDWELISGTGNGDTARVFGKKADGTEGGTTVDVSHSDFAGTQSCLAQVIRIQNWGGDPVVSNDVKADDKVANGTSINPDELIPGWGALDTLWLQILIITSSTGVSDTPPTGFLIFQGDIGPAMRMYTAWDEDAVASRDPDAWTITASTSMIAFLLAVRPPSSLPLGARVDRVVATTPAADWLTSIETLFSPEDLGTANMQLAAIVN